jgi:dTDP-4-dehydrorhamnose 3,5-epimerase
MNFTARPLEVPGVLLVETQRFADERGYFMECHHEGKFRDLGICARFVQDNRSFSKKGVLRGLHYQVGRPQGKLVSVLAGRVFDVAVDIRKESPAFGKWCGAELSGENGRMLWIPEGFAHGFLVLSESADVLYKCTVFYSPKDERAVLWSDPDVGIAWPDREPVLSAKDAAAPPLGAVREEDLP